MQAIDVAIGVVGFVLVAGYAAHGLKDFLQERRQWVANTRWWPPFCAAVDWLVATVLLAAPPGGQRATLERITYHETLPNGLEVIVVENHSVRDRMTALCVTGDRGESQRLRPRRPGTLASIS